MTPTRIGGTPTWKVPQGVRVISIIADDGSEWAYIADRRGYINVSPDHEDAVMAEGCVKVPEDDSDV